MRAAVVRWTVLVLLGLVLLGISATCSGYLYLAETTLPQTHGELELEGLQSTVEVEREAPFGVTHLRAQNDHDALFSLGTVHAQDRLWQMDFQRRVGAGRLSEVLGKATLEQDVFLRTMGFYRAAEQAYDDLSPESKKSVDAYVSGINAYLATDPPLPVEFKLLGYEPERWRTADVLVVAKLMSLDLSANYSTELERYRLVARGIKPARIEELMPPYPSDAPTILGAGESGRAEATRSDGVAAEVLLQKRALMPQFMDASNNWVVSGERTQSGEPLLANDPHLRLQVPSQWYLAHLKSPHLDVIGATLPGLPAVVIGRNERIAWGMTNVGADVQDLYVMDETADGDAYRYQGRRLAYGVRREEIEVKDDRNEPLTLRETVYGPVISDVVEDPGGKPLALRWTSLEKDDGTVDAFLAINQAEDWEAFNEALRHYNAPSQNFVYADSSGNIGYVAPGRFPVRKEGHTGLYPMPGDGRWNWQGWVPFKRWPRTLNPDKGFIVTANNKVTSESYPYTLSREWAEPYRARRINQMIEANGQLSSGDMVSMQQDRRSLLFHDFRPILDSINPDSQRARDWRGRLLSWDGDAGAGSAEAAVFGAWYAELVKLPAKEVGKKRWNEPRYLLDALRNGDQNCNLPSTRREEDCTEFAASAFEKALNGLGNETPEWGDVHRAEFEHPVLSDTPLAFFWNRDEAFGGDFSSVSVGPYDFETFTMDYGPTYRQIIDFSNLNGSQFIHPMGQSGNPISRHFDDLLPMWRDGRYIPMRTTGYPTGNRLLLRPEYDGG